jgi:hypothetical protein
MLCIIFSLLFIERLILCHVPEKLRINASPEICVYEQTITLLAAASMEYRSKQQPYEEMLGEAIGWKSCLRMIDSKVKVHPAFRSIRLIQMLAFESVV